MKYYVICKQYLDAHELFYYGKGSIENKGAKKSGDEIYSSYCYRTKKSAKDKLNKVIKFDKDNGIYSKKYWYRLITIEFNDIIYYRLP